MKFGVRIGVLGTWLFTICAAAVWMGAAPAQAQQVGAPASCSLNLLASDSFGGDFVAINFPVNSSSRYSVYINDQFWRSVLADESVSFQTRDLGSYTFELADDPADVNAPRTNCGTMDLGYKVTTPFACTVEELPTEAYVGWKLGSFVTDNQYVVRRTRDGFGPYWQTRVSSFDWRDVRMTEGTTYNYWVERISPAGRSERVDCGSITFGDLPDDPRPLLPSTCSVFVDNANNSATIAFVRSNSADGSDNVARFILRRSRDGGPSFWAGRLDVGPVDPNDRRTVITNGGLVAGSSYTYTIEGVNADGLGSPRAVCGTIQVVSGPQAVEICTVSLLNNTATVRFDPTPSDNADRYILRRSRNGGTSYWAGRRDADEPFPNLFTNGGLASNSSYTYTVESVAGDGTSSTPVTCGTVHTGSGSYYY